MTRRTTYALIAAALVVGCASGPPAAPGLSERRAINSDSTLELLETETRERAASEYDEAAREARAALFDSPRRFHRAAELDTLATLPRTGTVERTVSVPFGFGSTRLLPTPEQALRMRELFALADRIEVRGRTDGVGPRDGDEEVARYRAEAAKRYLIERGVPGRIISVGYIAGGDYVADNTKLAGRRANRRVDIEFVMPDEMLPAENEAVKWKQVPGS